MHTTTKNIPQLVVQIAKVGVLVPSNLANQLRPQKAQLQVVTTLFGRALTVAISHAGWEFKVDPGEPFLLINGVHTFTPFESYIALCSGKHSPQEWEEMTGNLGIAEIVT